MISKGFIRVSNNHQIYYERFGDLTKPTIIFLHGGPGIGFNEKDKQLFDFKTCNVLFYDQRGCKRSKSNNLLEQNTSYDLIDDIHTIINRFNIQHPILVGGSWGSSLALLYAIAYPDQVKGIVLRGLFLADKRSRFFFEKGGIKNLYPHVWKRFRSKFLAISDQDIMCHYHNEILRGSSRSDELSLELNLYGLIINSPKTELHQALKTINATNHLIKSKILSHYSINDFFIPDGYITNNFNTINKVPISIIHGKQDHITLIRFSQEVAKQHQNVTLIETNEGHSAYTPENKKEIIYAIQKMI